MSALSVRLPDSLHRAAREVAAEDGISINQLIATALAEKIAALKTEDFLRMRGQGANANDLVDILALVPDTELHPEDTPPTTLR